MAINNQNKALAEMIWPKAQFVQYAGGARHGGHSARDHEGVRLQAYDDRWTLVGQVDATSEIELTAKLREQVRNRSEI